MLGHCCEGQDCDQEAAIECPRCQKSYCIQHWHNEICMSCYLADAELQLQEIQKLKDKVAIENLLNSL